MLTDIPSLLRAILAASSDGIALVGADACFIEVNPAFGRLFGLEPEQIVGMGCMDLLGCREDCLYEPCRDVCMVYDALQRWRALPSVELDREVKGSPHSVDLSVTPVSKSLCLMMARDVTAMHDAARVKAKFLSLVTHELRAPLNAINGYLDLLLDGMAGELNQQQREFMRRARTGSEHLYALVEDLLLTARADAGQLRLNREQISIEEMITNAVEQLELSAIDNDITITVDVAEDVPLIQADAVRVQQVLRNLLSNALHFTSEGGSITIAARPMHDEQHGWVEVVIRDTGSGIAPEYQQRIFERFYQVPQSSGGRPGGQGLGLAVVKIIIELHGGQVLLESVPDGGSKFVFTLPFTLD